MSRESLACIAGCGRAAGTNGRYCSVCWLRLDGIAVLEHERAVSVPTWVEAPRRESWLSLEQLSSGDPVRAIQIETVAECQARERAEAVEAQERERLKQLMNQERMQRKRNAVYAGIAEKTKMAAPGIQARAIAQAVKTLPPLAETQTVRPVLVLDYIPYPEGAPKHRAVHIFAFRRYYNQGGPVCWKDGLPGWEPADEKDRSDPACCGPVLQKPHRKDHWQWHSKTAKHIANTYGEHLLTPRQLLDAYRFAVYKYRTAQGLAS